MGSDVGSGRRKNTYTHLCGVLLRFGDGVGNQVLSWPMAAV